MVLRISAVSVFKIIVMDHVFGNQVYLYFCSNKKYVIVIVKSLAVCIGIMKRFKTARHK